MQNDKSLMDYIERCKHEMIKSFLQIASEGIG